MRQRTRASVASFLLSRLHRQEINLGLNFHQGPAERTYRPVKVGRFSLFQVDKEPPPPCRQMLLEEIAVYVIGTDEASVDKASHDLTENCNMILGLGSLRPFDAEMFKRLAQPRRRPEVQRAGQIVGGVWRQLALTEPNKQIEEFASRTFFVGSAGSLT